MRLFEMPVDQEAVFFCLLCKLNILKAGAEIHRELFAKEAGPCLANRRAWCDIRSQRVSGLI